MFFNYASGGDVRDMKEATSRIKINKLLERVERNIHTSWAPGCPWIMAFYLSTKNPCRVEMGTLRQ
jgi:hypothetical protein